MTATARGDEEEEPELRPVVWVGSAKRDVLALPADVRQDFGYALYLAQCGEKSPRAKPMKGLGVGVLEVVENHEGNTYRAVYTVRFEEAVYVLHVFQKKSKTGIATPLPDVELIARRLKRAMEMHNERKKSNEG